MEAKQKVRLKSLEPYRHLFPKANVVDKTVKMGATVKDTVHFIPHIVQQCAWQVTKYVDQELRGLSPYNACKKLWDFVKYHIEYRPDKRGVEQVRSPRRLIHDGYGDCDCGTTFILTCLYVLKIPAVRRITKYEEDRFQHIYPIAIVNGKEVVIDFVVHAFNYEEPYTEKEDYKMDLQFLDGIDDRSPAIYGTDKEDLYGLGDLGDLGQLLRKARNKGGGIFKKKTPEQKKAKKEQRRQKLRKFANKANKFNAGAALLRAGVLASMKLNLMKVAEKLKWAYATPEQAKRYGMDMSKYPKLKQVLAKAENIFYLAGGKPENLRKAILTGRGNRRHEVAGFDGLGETTPINELLGAIYHDEFSGMDGLNGEGLGIATEAAIASATGAMGALAALLKSIGSLFPNKGKKKRDDDSGDNGGGSDGGGSSDSSDSSDTSETPPPSDPPAEDNSSGSDESSGGSDEDTTDSDDDSGSNNLPATTEDQTPATTSDEDSGDQPEQNDEGANGLLGLGGIKDFYQKNKKWIVPVGIAATAITVGLVINHYASKPEPKPQTQPIQQSTAVNGTPKRRNRKNAGKRNYKKQSVIALM